MNTYIITGGGSGIGLAISHTITDGRVLISGRSEDKLRKAVDELKGKGIDAHYMVADVTDRASVEALLKKGKDLGKVKGIINCAGVSGVGHEPIQTFKIDLVGAKILADEALKIAEEGMTLILIASMMGYAIAPDTAQDELLINPLEDENIKKLVEIAGDDGNKAYNLSKRGSHLLVQEMAGEFGKKGARILTISPGIIMTEMALKAAEAHPEAMEGLKRLTPAGRVGRPEDIANVAKFLLSDEASFITGSDIPVDGGLHLNLHLLAGLKG